MSAPLDQDAASATRKRKRNNSAASLLEGDPAPSLPTTPPASPTTTVAARSSRPSTPPSRRHHQISLSPEASRNLKSPDQTPTSPVVARSLGSDAGPAGSQSPRSVVAKRLSSLNLSRPESDNEALSTPVEIQLSDDKSYFQTDALSTPDIPAAASLERPPLEHHSSSNQRPKKRVPPPRGIRSPPPKGHNSPARGSNLEHESSNVPPDISSRTPSSPPNLTTSSTNASTSTTAPDPSTLTWQDAEITGHLMLDPDDDGYGINGLGFKPTPAMAAARAHRRRLQLTAWRTREEREERERRAEKRRVGRRAGDGAVYLGAVPTLNLEMDKKIVRFAV